MITSAALIMISVFASFILDLEVTTKMFGIGLSVAVFLDVTLIRMVLVPAVMSLLGHRAWWLPAWLERRLPTIDIEGGAHDGEEPGGRCASRSPSRSAAHAGLIIRVGVSKPRHRWLRPVPLGAGRSVVPGRH